MNKKTHKIAYKITKDLSMIRKRRGFTLRNLSQVCGISYSNLCNMENCKTSPSLNTLVNVCEALDAEILIKKKIRKKNMKDLLWNTLVIGLIIGTLFLLTVYFITSSIISR